MESIRPLPRNESSLEKLSLFCPKRKLSITKSRTLFSTACIQKFHRVLGRAGANKAAAQRTLDGEDRCERIGQGRGLGGALCAVS
jgi:hypothetical protein